MAVLLGAGGAVVLLKGFLRNTIEGERGNGGVTTWSGDAPGAMGAGPTGEVVPFDPDQAFTHTSPAFCVRLGLKLGEIGIGEALVLQFPVESSVINSRAANGYHFKTGQRKGS